MRWPNPKAFGSIKNETYAFFSEKWPSDTKANMLKVVLDKHCLGESEKKKKH